MVCSRLSDYDDLCARVAEQKHLTGSYRALMATKDRWLSNIFADVCLSAKIVNMKVRLIDLIVD